MPAYSSYLRIYEPLSAFPAAEQRVWGRYAAAGLAPEPTRGVRVESRAALVAAIGGPGATSVEHAFVKRRDGVVHVCPWRTRIRSWQAIAAFRRGLPDEIADAFVPRAEADIAERELARWRTEAPELKSHIRSETWQVPLRWFLPFEGEERRLRLDPDRSLTYLATMPDVRRRMARALAVLRRTVEEGPATEGVDELARWLGNYHARSLVELDYGGLVDLFDDDELYADESAADIAHAVASLAAGEADEATAAYARVAERWGAIRALEVAN